MLPVVAERLCRKILRLRARVVFRIYKPHTAITGSNDTYGAVGWDRVNSAGGPGFVLTFQPAFKEDGEFVGLAPSEPHVRRCHWQQIIGVAVVCPCGQCRIRRLLYESKRCRFVVWLARPRMRASKWWKTNLKLRFQEHFTLARRHSRLILDVPYTYAVYGRFMPAL